jgi:hypothetical protein
MNQAAALAAPRTTAHCSLHSQPATSWCLLQPLQGKEGQAEQLLPEGRHTCHAGGGRPAAAEQLRSQHLTRAPAAASPRVHVGMGDPASASLCPPARACLSQSAMPPARPCRLPTCRRLLLTSVWMPSSTRLAAQPWPRSARTWIWDPARSLSAWWVVNARGCCGGNACSAAEQPLAGRPQLQGAASRVLGVSDPSSPGLVRAGGQHSIAGLGLPGPGHARAQGQLRRLPAHGVPVPLMPDGRQQILQGRGAWPHAHAGVATPGALLGCQPWCSAWLPDLACLASLPLPAPACLHQGCLQPPRDALFLLPLLPCCRSA